MDPVGVLFAFGISMLVCGFVYRTPIPVQPMKAAGAIATTQAAQTSTITPAMVHGASLVTGVVWLVLGLTGTAHRVANLVKRPIVVGIILGLGFGFMIEGAKMMAQNWWIGGAALLVTSLLLTNRVIPGDVPAAAGRCGLRHLERPDAGCRPARRSASIRVCRNSHLCRI